MQQQDSIETYSCMTTFLIGYVLLKESVSQPVVQEAEMYYFVSKGLLQASSEANLCSETDRL